MLAALALRSWWICHAARAFDPAPTAGSTSDRPTSDHPLLATFISTILPWLLLAIIFYIPGVYLEYPSDPWMHFSRITEWSSLLNVGGHSVPNKSNYFLPYSILGNIPSDRQLSWLNVYYTAACLLLCWQYFRLAQGAGLSRRTAFLFVLAQTLLSGNSVFGFYRYYGIASTIVAEIAAIALIRLGLSAAGRESTGRKNPIVLTRERRLADSISSISRYWNLVPSATLLFILILLNHVQELGIAGLGLTAVAIWRLLEWRRSMLWWLSGAFLVLNVSAVFWWPRNPVLDVVYRPQGWLSAWYGFNILSAFSPAGDRMLQILGGFGIANLAAGVVLLRRNHVAGWLTIVPILALLSPAVAIPFAGALEHYGGWTNIISFHRLFFAIPTCLAASVFASAIFQRHSPKIKPVAWSAITGSGKEMRGIRNQEQNASFFPAVQTSGLLRSRFSFLIIVLLALNTVSPGTPYFNRFWHALMIPPSDLSMRPIWSDFYHYSQSHSYLPKAILAATSGISYVLSSQRTSRIALVGRNISDDHHSPTVDLEFIREILTPTSAITVIAPQPSTTYTPYSFAAIYSHHWLPQEVALGFSGAKELETMSGSSNLKPVHVMQHIKVYNK